MTPFTCIYFYISNSTLCVFYVFKYKSIMVWVKYSFLLIPTQSPNYLNATIDNMFSCNLSKPPHTCPRILEKLQFTLHLLYISKHLS